MSHVSTVGWTLLLVALSIGLYMLSSIAVFASTFILPVFGVLVANTNAQKPSSNTSNADWNIPNQTKINELNAVIDGSGAHGFIFNSSYAPPANHYYGGFNWCNMPHVHTQTYVEAPTGYTLEYVEVVSFKDARSFSNN